MSYFKKKLDRACCFLKFFSFPELKKLVSLILISFLISFNYYFLRIVKDTLVITASESGVEIIPFIKLFLLTPSAILTTILFSSISIKHGTKRTFYIFISGFVSFFILFISLIYPNKHFFELSFISNIIDSKFPAGMRGLSAMIRYWYLSIFYVVCDMWTPIMLNLCFWGFTNSVTSKEEASKVYPFIRLGLNFSGIASGYIGIYISSIPYSKEFLLGTNSWEQALTKTILLVIVCAILTTILFTDASNRLPRIEQCKKESKQTIKDQLNVLINSKATQLLSIMNFSIALTVNAVDILWKASAKHAFPDPISFSLYMNKAHIIIGTISVLTSLVMCSKYVYRLKLFVKSILTPSVASVTSLGFFSLILMPKISTFYLPNIFFYDHMDLLLFFGLLNSALVRAFKCSFFDMSKDIYFIMMERKERIIGKSVVDGIASKLGKSFASIMFTVLLAILKNLSSCSPFVASVVTCSIYGWIRSAFKLDNLMNKKVE